MRDFWILFLTKLHRWTERKLQREKLRRFLAQIGRNQRARWN